MQTRNGSLRIFQLFGVDVFVHWSWAIVGALEVWRNNARDAVPGLPVHSIPFYIAQYLCLFLIVLLHEFGHALACKSVGGVADRIFLWPLGGIAFVQPPQRPGALLWSIVAGPLVNVVLLPLTIIPAVLLQTIHPGLPITDFLSELAFINAILLAFNILPIYPLDGGQILRALLWFLTGRGISLVIAASIGIVGAMTLIAISVVIGEFWMALIFAFIGMQAFRSMKVGSAMRRLESAPRHTDATCPSCKQNPPLGQFWKCSCDTKFDTFATNAQCPGCGKTFTTTACPLCAKSCPRALWYSTGGFTVSPDAPAPTIL